jgi:uncharacterized membrane protein
MKRSQTLLAIATMLAIMGLYTAAIYGHLPDKMPIHWNIRGEVDGWADKKVAVMVMPAITLFITALLMGLPAITPVQFRSNLQGTTGEIYNYVCCVVVGLFCYIHGVMLQSALHPQMGFNRALFSGMFLFFGLLGNVMGKMRRNPWMGVKTPWTLASDKVWDPTHRLAGKLMVSTGLLGAAWCLAGLTPVPVFVLFMVASLYPLPYSYMLYKRLEKSGGL